MRKEEREREREKKGGGVTSYATVLPHTAAAHRLITRAVRESTIVIVPGTLLVFYYQFCP